MALRVLYPLAALIPGSRLPPAAALEGQIVSTRPFNPSTLSASLTLADTQGSHRVQLELRGSWAQKATQQLTLLVGRGALRVFAREGENARVEVVPPVGGARGQDVPAGKRTRVVFEMGIQGWWIDSESGRMGQNFEYRAETATVPSKRPAKPLAHSLSDDEGATVDTAPPPARASTLSRRDNLPSRPLPSQQQRRDKLVVPMGNPNSPWVGLAAHGEASTGTATSTGTGTSAASGANATGTSQRSATGEPKAKKQRESRDVRTTWGLSSPVTNHIYVALDTLASRKNGAGVNLIAMAIVSKPLAKMTSGSQDWACMLHLYDPTNASTGFVVEVRYYGKLEQDIPVVQDGDIIVIQGLNWSKDRQQFTAYAGKGFFYVLPPAQLLDGAQLGAFKAPPTRAASMTDAELSYARELARWAKKHALLENVLGGFAAKSGAVPQAPPGSDAVARSAMLRKGAGKGRRLVRVEEVCADTFCDIQGEIVKFYKPFGGSVGPFDACSLFITDYTTNDQLYAYSDTSEVRTPGQVTLQVSIFGAQNDPLLSLSEDKLVGRLVYLRNVRPKMTLNDFLEATMIEDGKYSERRDVRLLRENDTTKEWRDAFKARRATYWASVTGGDVGGPAPSTGGEDSSSSKVVEDPLASICDTSGLTPQSISSALALGLAGTFRFRARVIDFLPDRLEDWVRAYCPTCGDELSPSEVTCLEHKQAEHEWRFMLALADEENEASGDTPPHLFLPVAGEAGHALFPAFNPALLSSLRFGESTALSALKSRLRGLLGSLVETKRHKKPVLFSHAGPAWDVVLEGRKDSTVDGGMRWFFAEGRVAFR